ncbi:Stk1 family PASTA domain-containing Ser/Thr kinase [Pseudonocardia sp. KRD291]|uniref:Stk1 family PASTA domain-containing Ser/Thr kinase n=1 Tax=Pseudonocardia sp. KRD291 TaxID=2792007 RepID=UPI001C4A54FE|nr:Stk1 family PASTA domain-containing Ser/Thr kinase [Pseudonocardia sp. KRD291]MBW0105925.1 Stk1 family PASTA domain-containing Ser/Thr kinase [Pseudonocardia sp. KRD291]
MSAPSGPADTLLDQRYRLGPVIARGGMSTVYRGVDTRLDRAVAIKVMDPRMAGDQAFRARFEREARLAARIDHPSVVGVHDQGRIDASDGFGEPTLFLVLELVEGGTLRDVLKSRGALGLPAAVRVLEPVLAGLAQAHRLGMVHRDVKPENVLISQTGEVKVADFGLLTAAAQAGVSHAGMILGTMAYLSPEQVETGRADARSDVYAAGIMLYELLTGRPPYQADNPLSVAYRHVNDEVPPPSATVPGLPPEIDRLVARATAREPGERPADADAFLHELATVAERLGLPRVPVPRPPENPDSHDTVPATPRRIRPDAADAGPGGTRAVTGLAPAAATDGPAPEPEGMTRSELRGARRRSRRVFALWVAVLLVLGLLVGTGAWWLGSGRWTAMPSVAGLERDRATALVAEADLTPSIAERADDDVATGTVVVADPQPDTRVLRGSTVTLTVSTGRPVVPEVPSGATVAAAEDIVRRAGLAPVRSTTADAYSDTVPQGAVLRTDPAAGTPVPGGSPVTLAVSLGAEPAPPPTPEPTPEPESTEGPVPFVIGKDVDEATEELRSAGYSVEVESTFGFTRRNPKVVGQDPGAGDDADAGTTVTLNVL